MCYLTIDAFRGDGVYRQDILDSLPALHETKHVRHVRIDGGLVVKVDGRRKEAVVMVAGNAQPQDT